MTRTKHEMTEVLALAFASFTSLAKYAPGPTQKEVATERAGNCLWALGIEEYAGFRAVKPETLGETIEAVATRVIADTGGGRET
jgi:hypothetical protein